MIQIPYNQIKSAFLFVSVLPKYNNRALVSKKTGEFHYITELGDPVEPTDETEYSEDNIEMPHKDDLDLGKRLVIDFTKECMPEEIEIVNDFFRKKGAYSGYNKWLEKNGLLEKWRQYESIRQDEALKKWCSEVGIEIIE